jgi:Ala-tRNA(Pro) deacylase
MSQVTEHLESRGFEFEVLPHEPTETGLAEADSLGLSASDVAKTVVLDLRTGHAFAVVPADRFVDLDAVRQLINSRHVHLAEEDEIRRDYPEFQLGAIPPLGALAHTPLVVDRSIIEHDEIVFAGGEKEVSIRMKTADLFGDAQMLVGDICYD